MSLQRELNRSMRAHKLWKCSCAGQVHAHKKTAHDVGIELLHSLVLLANSSVEKN